MPGLGDFLAQIAQRLGQQAQATQQGTLGLGPDPNAPPAPFGHPLSIHYGALPGFLAMPLRAAITPLQMAGLVGEAGQVVGRMGTGTAGAGVAALQNALNSPYGGAVSTLAHTAPVLGSLADAIQVGQHLGRLNPMEVGPLHTADAQRALAAFRADPGIQGEVAANEALAQGNKYATGLANTLLNPLTYAGGLGELGASMRAASLGVDALGGLAPTAEPLAIRTLGGVLQGLGKVGELGNAPGAAAFTGAFNLLRGRGPVAALTAAGAHLGLGGMVPRFLPGMEDLAAALGRPGVAVPGAPPTAVPLPTGPPLATGLEDLQRALGGAPPAGLLPAGGGGIAPGYVPPVLPPTSHLPRLLDTAQEAGAMFGAPLPPELTPIASVRGNMPPGQLPLISGLRQLGPDLPPQLQPSASVPGNVPGRLGPLGPPLAPELMPIASRPGNVPQGVLGPRLPAGSVPPALPPELQPIASIRGNVPKVQGPLGPALPPELQPAVSRPGNVPRGQLGPPAPGRTTVPPTRWPTPAAPALPDPTESLADVLSGAPPATLPPTPAAPPVSPLEAFLGDTAASYRTPAVPSPTEALSAPAGLPEAAAATAAPATNWADRAGVIRQVANAPLAHLNSVLADLHNALYPGRQADFAIPSLTGQPKAAFRTSMLTDAAGQNRAEPYLDYLLNRVQKDPAAATRLAAINPTLADDATRLATTDIAPEAHKAAIQALFKGPPGTLDDFNALLSGKWSTSMYLPPEGAFAKELGVPIAQARRWIDDAIAGGTLARDATGQLTFAPRGPGAAAPPVADLTPPALAVTPPAAPEAAVTSAATAPTGVPVTFEQFKRGLLYDAPLTRGEASQLNKEVGSKSWKAGDIPHPAAKEWLVSKNLRYLGADVPNAQARYQEYLASRAASPGGDIAAGGGGQGLGLIPPRLPQTLGGAVAGGVVGAGVGAATDEDNRLRGALKGAGLGVLAGGGLGSGIPDAYAAPFGALAKEGAAAMRQAVATGEKGLLPEKGNMMAYIRANRKTGLFVIPRNALGAMGNIVMGGGDLSQAVRYAGEFWRNLPTFLPAIRAAGSDEAARAAAMYAALPADMQQYGPEGITKLLAASGSAYERNAADLGAANVHPAAGFARGIGLAMANPRTVAIGGPSLVLGGLEGASLPARVAVQNAAATTMDVGGRLGAFAFTPYAAGLEAEAPGFVAKATAAYPSLAGRLDLQGRFDPADILAASPAGAPPVPGLQSLADEWAGIQSAVSDAAGGVTLDRMGSFGTTKGAMGLFNALFPGGVWNVGQAAVLARAASEHPALAMAALGAMQQDYQDHLQRGDPQHAGTWELTDKTPGFGALVRLAAGGPGSFYVNPAYPFSPFSGETLNLPRELDPRLNPNQTLYDRAMKVASAAGLAVNPEIQAVAYKEGASSTPMTPPLRLAPIGQWADAKLGLGLTANPLAQGLDPQGSVQNMEDINLQLRRGQYLDPAIARAGAEIIYEQTGRPASDPSNAPLLAQLRDHNTPLYQQAEARGLGGKAALAGINEALPVSGQAEGQTAGDVARAQMQLFARGIPFTKAQITALGGGDMTTASMAVQAALDRAKLANPLLAVNDAASPQAQAQALASDFIRQNRGLQGLWPELFNVAYQAQQERLGLVPAGTMAGLQQQMDWRNAGLQPGGYMIGPGMPMPDYSSAAEGVRQLMRDRLAAGR